MTSSGGILVTGVGTALGQQLVIKLASSGHAVTAIYRSQNAWVSELEGHPKVSLVQGDLSNLSTLKTLTANACSSMVHLAATSPRPELKFNEMVRDNVIATGNLVDLAVRLGTRRFIFASNISVYGTVKGATVDAHTAIVNPTPYGVTKRVCEQLLEAVSNRLSAVALRLPALLARGAKRHWLARVLDRAHADEDIVIFNPSAPHNNAVDAAYLATFISQLVQRDIEGFSAVPLGAAGQLSIEQVVQRIVEGTGSRSRIVVQSRPVSTAFSIDYRVASELFDYLPPSIGESIDRFIEVNR